MTILSRPEPPPGFPDLSPLSPDGAAFLGGGADPQDGSGYLPPAAEQFWLHPDAEIFLDHAADVASALQTCLRRLPPRLSAGPLGCATAGNVAEFLREGQPDRAWRLAARLFLAARAAGLPACAGQVADDLAISALLLAGERHGCALGALEAALVIGRLMEGAAAGALNYPDLALSPEALARAMHGRRLSVLEQAARGMVVDSISPDSAEGLMWRAPITRGGGGPFRRLR